jgi:hypothetical protein
VRFWLGVHRPNWLARDGVPLFISRTVLEKRARMPEARVPWALDSGGFTALSRPPYRWALGPEDYLERIAFFATAGRLEWAAPQDWMCEPWIVENTGLSVREHQERTVENYLTLRGRGVVPIIPVLQGWSYEDYEVCMDLYAQAGVDLHAEPLVGLGSVCRRQNTDEIGWLVQSLALTGLRLHGFGVKRTGLERYGHYLASADSMAWSFRARRSPPLPGHTHMNCANCHEYALLWAAGAIS